MKSLTRIIPAHKFHARKTECDGIVFASKKEADVYQKFKALQKSGEILFFLRQTPFHLPGGVKYVADFTVFWSDGRCEFCDVKGMRTDMYKTKKKLVESLYPITITEI